MIHAETDKHMHIRALPEAAKALPRSSEFTR